MRPIALEYYHARVKEGGRYLAQKNCKFYHLLKYLEDKTPILKTFYPI